MADTKISALPVAAALTGAELIPGVQSAADVAMTPAQIANYVGLIIFGQSGAAHTHTGDTLETNLVNVKLPANSLGANGVLKITALWSRSAATTNTVAFNIRLSATQGDVSGGMFLCEVVDNTSGSVGYQTCGIVRNANATGAQVAGFNTSNIGTFTGSFVASGTGTLDTTADIWINFNVRCTTSSADTGGLLGYTIELMPHA